MSQAKDWETEMIIMNKAPYFRLLGMEVLELAEGYARLVVPVEKKLNNLLGVVHGGVLSSLADAAVAIAIRTIIEPDKKPLTVELNINYLGPIYGDQVIAEAKIIRQGRAIVVGDVDITDKTGRLIAKSRATYMIVA